MASKESVNHPTQFYATHRRGVHFVANDDDAASMGDDVCFVLTANGEWAPFATSTAQKEEEEEEGAHAEEASLTRDIGTKLWNASTWLDMVNDAKRNEAFANGLAATLRSGDVALDIGAGTGILSVMASRIVGPSPGRVDALEEFGPSAVVARRVVESNGVGDRVRVIQRRSDDHEDGEKYDVVFSELLDSSLIGEGWLGVVRDAKRRLLRRGGRVLPRRARVYARLVECADAFEYYSPTSRPSASPPNFASGTDAPTVIWCDESQQAHAKAWRRTMRAISDDVMIAEMDFENLPDEGAEPVWRKPLAIQGSGRAHAVLTWWEIDLDENGIATYSTKPGAQSAWCHHWRQCLKLMPANVRLTVDSNSTLEFVSTFDGDTIYVGISGGIANEDDGYVRSASLSIEPPIEAPWTRHLDDDSSSRARLVCFGANLPEFVASKSSLDVVHGVDLSKANALLCPKETTLHPNAPSGAKSLEFLPSIIHVFELGLSLESAAATPPAELMRFGTSQTEGCVTITASNDDEMFDSIIIHLDVPVSADGTNEKADPFAPPTHRSLADAARQAVLIIPEHARRASLNLWYTVVNPSSSSSSVRDLRFALIP